MNIIEKSASYHEPMVGVSVSIIVPVYNTAPYVLATLRSLEAETPDSHEIIIVHDGGTDDSCTLARAWVVETKSRAIIIDRANAGLSAARMTGLKHARGAYVGFLDSDDIAALGIYSEMASFASRPRRSQPGARITGKYGATPPRHFLWKAGWLGLTNFSDIKGLETLHRLRFSRP